MKTESKTKKTIVCFLISAFLMRFTAFTTFLAKTYKAQFFSVYTGISLKTVGFLSEITSFTSFDLWEIIAFALIVWTVANLVAKIKNRQLLLWVSQTVLCVCILVAMFVNLWGLNYYAPSMASRLGFDECQYTPAQLAEATIYFRDKADEYADRVARDENGLMITDFDTMSYEAGNGYKRLSETYSIFGGSTARVKKLITGRIFTMRGTTGIFVCITGESNVSEYVFSRGLPLTMCHEIGHRMAFAREDESNFAGYLACEASETDEFLYSGYYHAFIWCYNALYRADRETAISIIMNRSDTLKSDIIASSEHYKKIEIQKAVEISDEIYEKYLESFDVTEGMQSYGMVVDLLAMYYFQVLK